ncbi:2,3-dimethylmalate lyase [Lachnellula subtilissima]|uniref:2,3-dimethylmalate lyase n=1 Tax=Lachnellula subtilissima TaxID=602034 RepID=A0A8H8UAP2_9HELO|nr:2,3-dimethylmalate lyase [Lachnellula subtilissima]
METMSLVETQPLLEKEPPFLSVLSVPTATTTVDPPKVTVDVPAESDSILVSFNRVSQSPIAVSNNLSAATKLKKMIEDTDELIVCPGVYDGLSARIALRVGFSAMYMPDLGIAHLHDMKEHAEMIANLEPYGPPLIADMDTGYGGPIMVANSVKSYIRAGVAGFHIEDQVMNKRCGHLKGKKVVPNEEFYTRVRAAKSAKDAMHSDIVLIARTDALQMLGYDECVKRLKVARSLGADVGLLEGYTSKEMAAQAVKDLAPWPLLLNMVENGATPIITTKEAKEMGFRIMIFSFASIAPAYVAIQATLERLKAEGVVGTPKDLTPLKLFDMCGLQDSMTVDIESGGLSFASGV